MTTDAKLLADIKYELQRMRMGAPVDKARVALLIDRINSAREYVPLRVLDQSDSFCPSCGHNRDKSSVSSIDNEDGTRSCQMCNARWIERTDISGERS